MNLIKIRRVYDCVTYNYIECSDAIQVPVNAIGALGNGDVKVLTGVSAEFQDVQEYCSIRKGALVPMTEVIFGFFQYKLTSGLTAINEMTVIRPWTFLETK